MFEIGLQRLTGNTLKNKPLTDRREPIKVVMDIAFAENVVKVELKPGSSTTDFAGGHVSFALNNRVESVTFTTKTHYAGAFMYVYVSLQINGGVQRSYLHMDAGWVANGIENVEACTFSDNYMAYIYNQMETLNMKDIILRVYDITNGPRQVFETELTLPSPSTAPTPIAREVSMLYPGAKLQIVEDQLVEYCLGDESEWAAIRFAQQRPVIKYSEVIDRIKSGETHFEHNWEGTGWQLIYTMDKRDKALSKKQNALFQNTDALEEICNRKLWSTNYRTFSKDKTENVGFITLTEGGVLKAASMFRCNDREEYIPIPGKRRMPEIELMLICARQTSPKKTGTAFMEMLITQGEKLYEGKHFLFTIAQAGDDVIQYYKNVVGAELNPSHTLSIQYPWDNYMTLDVATDRKRKRVYSEKEMRLLLV